MGKDFRKEIAGLFAEQKTRIAELYAVFAGKYPDLRDLWETLAREKTEHAEIHKDLCSKMDTREVVFDEGRLRTYTVRSSIAYIHGIVEKTVKEHVPLPNALALALDIEKSLLVKKAPDMFKGVTPAAVQLIRRLREESDGHALRIEAELQKIRTMGKTFTP